MITHRSWLGISNRECLIESDTRHQHDCQCAAAGSETCCGKDSSDAP